MAINLELGKQYSLFKEHLSQIKSVRFTQREIDVIACILHSRAEKKIAVLLGISPKTVAAHVYNIMSKLGFNSKDKIIDFIETSGKLLYLREYYFYLLIEYEFIKSLEKVGRLYSRDIITCYYKPEQIKTCGTLIFGTVKKHLATVNISLVPQNKNKMTSQSVNIDLSKISSESYYHDLIQFIKSILDKEGIQSLYEAFSKEYKLRQETFKKFGTVKLVSSQEKKKAPQVNFMVLAWLLGFLLLLGAIYIGFNNIYNNAYVISEQLKDKEKIEEFKKFIKEYKISVNNLGDKQFYKNQNFIQDNKRFLTPEYHKVIKDYYANIQTLPEDLVLYLEYCIGLANYNLYHNNNNGSDIARKLIFSVKDIIDAQIVRRSSVNFNLDDLPAIERLSELNRIPHFAEIYVKTFYFIGRSYLYSQEIDEAEKYFEISIALGEKLGMFESFLSRRSGMVVVNDMRISQLLDANDLSKARDIISKNIALLKLLSQDKKKYILNYNPTKENQAVVSPYDDLFNRIDCYEKMITQLGNYYYITSIVSDKKNNFEEIKKSIKNNAVIFDKLNQIPSRKVSAFYNSLGRFLLIISECNLQDANLIKLVKKCLIIEENNRLEIIKNIFEKSISISRNSDYTKADAYEGLVMTLKKIMEQDNFPTQKIEETKKLIEVAREKKDHINNSLNRRSHFLSILSLK